jgi:putative phage-type endonuclease
MLSVLIVTENERIRGNKMEVEKYIHHFEQGEPSWHEWRKTGLGASNMSVLMGSLPFQYEDVLTLWKEKALGIKIDRFSAAINEGWANEEEARQVYIKKTGIQVKPVCLTHPEYPFLRASLDGLSDDRKIVVEIKCPQPGNFKKAQQGKVLDYYYTQLQQQVGICNALFGNETVDYYVYRGGQDVLFRVPFNRAYFAEIIRRGKMFWDMVESKTPALPRHFGLEMMQAYSQPYVVEGMTWERVQLPS